MISLVPWQTTLLSLSLTFLALLLVVWWRQQSYQWIVVLVTCLLAAPLLSWWSGVVFQVADYRAGCDGLCLGFRGAPVRIYQNQTAGGRFIPGMFLLNSLAYLTILLAWTAVIRAVLGRAQSNSRARAGQRAVLALVLVIGPLALAPLYLPPPEAHVRGDSQRIAINARREVYMYDQLAPMPVLRVGLEDVRPRRDDRPGMRVCLRLYTFFYMTVGSMYMDMAPEGIHSTAGGVLPHSESCWE